MVLKTQAARLKTALFDIVDPDRAWYGISRRGSPTEIVRRYSFVRLNRAAIESLTAGIVRQSKFQNPLV